MAPQGRWRRWRWRVTAAAGALVAAALAAGVWAETTARRLHLDYRQGPAMSTSSLATRPAVVGGVDLTGMDYLPRVLAIHDGVLRTGFGACLLRSERPTILALGDSTTVQGSMEGKPSEFLETWPTRLPVGPDAQVCALAEVGYHPSDLATLVAAFGDRLRADRTVLLLCGNDLGGQAPRAFLEVAGSSSLVEAPRTFRYWRRLWSPWLAERSEAYRFASYTMASRSGRRSDVNPATPPI